jgi:mannitol/fructose-specific phosphotransferase system IIA component (Ntr-type)
MLNDMAGWMGFAVVMALIAPAVGGEPAVSMLAGLSQTVDALPGVIAAADPAGTTGGGGAAGVGRILLMTLGFLVVTMTIGRWAFHRALPLIQAHWSWPGGTLSVVLVLTLISAAVTEWIGVHAIFGAFIAGVAIGDSHHLRERTRSVIEQFIMNIFAPLFFASVGLGVNFVSAFNPIAVGVAMVIAFTGKTTGCFIGARLAGFAPRESAAIGFGMVAQGTMGVILGQLALEAQLINDEMFVAIVMVALATSIAAGPGMQKALRQKQARGLGDYLTEKRYVADMKALTSQQAIDELCTAAAESNGLDQARVFAAVWRREQIMHTGLGNGVAVPHARLDEIKEPVVVIGRSAGGIDFDASDGKPAHIICLLLTPGGDHTAQVELLRLVAESFGNPQSMQEALEAKSFTQFLVAIKLKGEE